MVIKYLILWIYNIWYIFLKIYIVKLFLNHVFIYHGHTYLTRTHKSVELSVISLAEPPAAPLLTRSLRVQSVHLFWNDRLCDCCVFEGKGHIAWHLFLLSSSVNRLWDQMSRKRGLDPAKIVKGSVRTRSSLQLYHKRQICCVSLCTESQMRIS